jgi:hypothetical protein
MRVMVATSEGGLPSGTPAFVSHGQAPVGQNQAPAGTSHTSYPWSFETSQARLPPM